MPWLQKKSEAPVAPAVRCRVRKRPGNGAAFTLIEVLVAVVVLSAGIVLVLRAMNTALLASDRSREGGFASLLARQHLESAALKLAEGAVPADLSGAETADSPWGGPEWSVETAAEDMSGQSGSGNATGRLVKVSVVLKQAGSPRSYSHTVYAAGR